MSEEPWKKKLIEVALPLDAINAESAREKSIRHGHPSTLHLWWARRPLAACRAVLFSQLVDDPSAHPEQFPTEEDQDRERERLFKIIEDLVKWENSTNEEVLEAARAEIRRSCDGNPPAILDPFAGGGSIPLEAQRLGLEAHASDLNPVAVLINRALIEIPPRWAGHPPVHPEAENRTRWEQNEGLAEDVRRYGKWMRDEAEKRIGYLYPKATLPDGSRANVIAWIWARTVTCPNPGCGATMPLVRSFWLSTKAGHERYLTFSTQHRTAQWSVGGPAGIPPESPKISSRGANFRCIFCGEVAKEQDVKELLLSNLDSLYHLATAIDLPNGRDFLPGDGLVQMKSERRSGPDLSSNSRHMGGVSYGFRAADSFYTVRQLKLFRMMLELTAEVSSRIDRDMPRSRATQSYRRDLMVLLGLSVAKMARFHTTLSTWRPDEQKFSRAFGGPAMEMTWDFAEANPFGNSGGDLTGLIEGTSDALRRLRAKNTGDAQQRNAVDIAKLGATDQVICTDPPYYDNVPYSDLSDHFYYWIRQALGSDEKELLATTLTPKVEEIVADVVRSGSKKAADAWFQAGLNQFFSAALSFTNPRFPFCVFYAFKQGEKIRSSDDLLGSTGWATMLDGLIDARWQIVATWPLLTEGKTRRRGQGSNALMSSVVLACRPRSSAAATTDRQGFTRSLRRELPDKLRDLQKANIAPVDLRQAAIGPGMSVFSRYSRVIEADDSSMRAQTALGLINQVLSTVLDEQEEEFDAETRWAIQWYAQFFADEGPYGVAEQLAISMNVAVGRMVESGILTSGGGKVRLLGRDELSDDWDPARDLRTPVWEATQHLVKRLETDGEAATGQLLRQLGGLGASAQLLAYRLYTVCEKTRPALAGPYNAIVTSWPEIQRYARDASQATMMTSEQQSFDA